MGLSPSKRASRAFETSTTFATACDAVFDEIVALTQGRFTGIFPYQLSDAARRLHDRLRSLSFPLIKRWVPTPPSQAQVDRAYRSSDHAPESETLDRHQFRNFAVALFTDAVVSAAVKETAVMLPLCAAEIAGVGMVTRARKDLIGGLIAAYAVTAATSIYLSLGK